MKYMTPAAKLPSRKATVSNAIQKARARLPIIVKVFGKSTVALIILPQPLLLLEERYGSYSKCTKKNKL